MTQRREEPSVVVSPQAAATVEADLLIMPMAEGDDPPELAALDQAAGGELDRARRRGEFASRPGEIVVTPLTGDGWRAGRVAWLGVGAIDEATSGRVRTALTGAMSEIRRRRASRIGLLLRGRLTTERVTQAAVEGMLIGAYEDRRYKTAVGGEPIGPAVSSVIVAPSEASDRLAEAVRRAVALAEATNHARDLANEPPNHLTPTSFAERAAALARDAGLTTEVLDERAIDALGMRLLQGVARGSDEPPRLLVMRHDPPGAGTGPLLALVGKGVTFDSGGISLKPADGMARMKGDMAGGAAVVGAMLAIARLQSERRCLGVVPIVENMPGGRATRPGDVLVSASGTTVEVLNTDAEGRLILGDALWYAREQGATHLVDVATLTGACVVALGHVASGLFGRPSSWVDVVRDAAARTGERVWPLPLYDEYREQLRSDTADLANVGGRPGGACTAAAFLEAFAGDTPWVHLDIAGTSWTEDTKREHPKGATGVMVRTLAELAATADWPTATSDRETS